MEIKAFTLDENTRLPPIAPEDLSQEWLIDQVPRWIDVDASEADALADFLAPLGIPQPIIQSCLRPSEEPELAHYENMVYIEFPLIIKNRIYDRTYVSIIVLPTTLITIHSETVSTISMLETRLSMETLFHSSEISGLLHEIIVYLLRQNYHYFLDVRTQINYLSNGIIEKPDAVELGDILKIIRLVDFFITVVEDQHYCIETFLDGNGRTSRLLSTLCLYKAGYDFKRLFTISEYYDRDRPTFYKKIQCVRENDMDMTVWLDYFITGLETQMIEVKERGEQVIRRDILTQKHNLNERQSKAIEYLLQYDRLTIQDYEVLCPEVNRRSLQRDFKIMIEKELIDSEGATNQLVYLLRV